MFTGMKKVARAAAVAVAAGAFVLIAPAGTAFAIDKVDCDPDAAFLEVQTNRSGPFGSTDQDVQCFANAGSFDFGGRFIDKISTGNNDVLLHDANGDVVKIERFHEITFPNRPPKVDTIEIL